MALLPGMENDSDEELIEWFINLHRLRLVISSGMYRLFHCPQTNIATPMENPGTRCEEEGFSRLDCGEPLGHVRDSIASSNSEDTATYLEAFRPGRSYLRSNVRQIQWFLNVRTPVQVRFQLALQDEQ
jgi:hypothetical protein